MIDDYKASDFRDLFFDTYNMGEKEDLFVRFPVIQGYKSFRQTLPGELPVVKVFRYISFAFDKATPLTNLNDIMKIRHHAAVLAGFKYTESGKFNPVVEEMLYSKNREVNNMIITFCMITSNEDWTTLTAFSEALRRENEKLLDPAGEAADRDKSLKIINSLRTEIAHLKKSLLHSEKDSLLEKSLYLFSEAEQLGLSPEAYADKLELSRAKIQPRNS